MFNFTKENYHEMVEMEKDAHRLGIPLFRVMYTGYVEYLKKNNLKHSDSTLIAYDEQIVKSKQLRK